MSRQALMVDIVRHLEAIASDRPALLLAVFQLRRLLELPPAPPLAEAARLRAPTAVLLVEALRLVQVLAAETPLLLHVAEPSLAACRPASPTGQAIHNPGELARLDPVR